MDSEVFNDYVLGGAKKKPKEKPKEKEKGIIEKIKKIEIVKELKKKGKSGKIERNVLIVNHQLYPSIYFLYQLFLTILVLQYNF